MSSRLGRAACLAGLLLGSATAAGAAPQPGVALWWVAAPEAQEAWSATVRDQLGEPAAAVLRQVVAAPVHFATAPLADAGLLMNLRELPERLAAAGEIAGGEGERRHVICAQIRRGDGTAVIEFAVCDLDRAVLLTYKAGECPLESVERRFLELLLEVAQGSLPETRRTVNASHAAGGEPVRDAPLNMTQLPDGVWSQAALDSLMVTGLGEPSGPVRVLTETRRLMANHAGASGQRPLNISIYRSREQTQVEIEAEAPLESYTIPRRGAWAAVDVDGLRVAGEHRLEIGRSGLVGLVVKPSDDEPEATRIGFELTDAGELRLNLSQDRRRLTITVGKDVAPPAAGEVSNPDLPFASYEVVRSFSGMASWYGGKWHGRRTASGEVYNQWAWTAAHRSLPMGTWVKVTNVANGRSAIVRINDRGPFVRGRVLDVSAACAQALGFYSRGVTQVQAGVLRVGG